MQCSKHPKYKGLTKLGKRNQDCLVCKQIFQIANEEKAKKRKEKNIYKSLSSPSQSVDLAHILAETMTMMKYGIQCENFWKQDNTTSNDIKHFFFNALKMAYIWIGKNMWASNSLKGLFGIVVIKPESDKQLKQDISNTQVNIIIEDVGKGKTYETLRDYMDSKISECQPKKDIFRLLNEE